MNPISTFVQQSPARVQQTRDWADDPISPEAWAELEALDFSADDPEARRTYTPGKSRLKVRPAEILMQLIRSNNLS